MNEDDEFELDEELDEFEQKPLDYDGEIDTDLADDPTPVDPEVEGMQGLDEDDE